jgi:hypothetical protein
MARGRQREEWGRLAVLLAHLANLAPFRSGSRVYSANDFLPLEFREERPAAPKVGIGVLKVFLPKKN